MLIVLHKISDFVDAKVSKPILQRNDSIEADFLFLIEFIYKEI
jgi:hypothetical protein